ncbi:MAG: hypothetical protein IM496_17445 [Microcystis sp. M049S2]|uniref:hypothetical protein n=1 Tax=Microcystis sp. M049S2 TaxID=2771169 RepID=UPI00258761C0|nr:hypothetical protein [Microcystis sp. M049S2]MCA2660207.1 hypothetical protein [Microcystis sp. M049S2]
MPNNNNQPDINKAIDVCMEEYKTLRTEILQTVQNRTNVIVFGGALVLTLLGIGISPIANLPIMKETTTVTRIPTDTTTIEKRTGNTIKQTISHPKADSNHTNQEKNSGLVIKEKDTETETISRQSFYDIPIERRIPSAIILGIIVPASCILIILLVHGNTYLIVRIGRYIATNIEPKINDLYFNNLPSGQKPIIWESYMQTLKTEAEENTWVMVVFGGIALVANIGGIFSIFNIAELKIALATMFNNGSLFVLLIILGIVFLAIIIFIVVGLKTGNKIIQLRDGEGSLKKIWYKGINPQNKEVKSTRIFWKSNHRVWETYQIVKSMIDEGEDKQGLLDKLINNFKNLLDKVKNYFKGQAPEADTNDLFKNLLKEIKNYSGNLEYNPPFPFKLNNGKPKDINNILELLQLCIDYPKKFKEHMDRRDFERWLHDIKGGETELANIAQATPEKNFSNDNERLHYFLRECYLNKLINDLKNLLKEIKNYSRTPKYNPTFYFNLDKGRGKDVNNIPELLELCIDNPNKFKEHMDKGDFERWLDNIEIGETELANIAQATREKNDNERLHYFLRECCLVLIGRNP